MKYKILFLDWHKTLSHSLFWEQWLDAGQPMKDYHQKVTDFILIHNKDLFDQWMLGTASTEGIVEKISIGCNIDQEILYKDLRESCGGMSFVFPELPQYIRALHKKGVKCVIATDNIDKFREWTYEAMQLDELFDGLLVSAELGVTKYGSCTEGKIPFFDTFLRDNRLAYADVVLIDDNVDDGYFARYDFDIIQVTKDDSLKDILTDFLA